MDPMLMIGLFFGAGLVFLAVFVIVMLKLDPKGKPGNIKEPKQDLPSQRDIGGF